jgi:predicted DNA-binding transcriptional regulator AlpA
MGETLEVDTAVRLLRTHEVAAWLAVSKSTLVRWRQSLEGPQVYWLADGVPRYRASDVEQWLRRRSAARPRPPRRGGTHAGAPR